MSWVPMYGFREESGFVTVAVGDLKRRDLGFAAVRADGRRLFLSRRDLNVPPANFRRLYQERSFGEGPPQHRRERAGLMAFNRWWYETLIGEDPALKADYQGDLLTSVNATLGHGPGDPARIVQLEAHLDFATFTREQLDRGDLANPRRERRVAIITDQGTTVTRAPLAGPLAPMGI
ncbi:MAG: hypothetical protein ACREB5_05530 [Sphingomonadaceae bacterium]